MDLSKKSQISVQFNWIFVLIAGALILIFFIGTVYKIKASAKETLACNILADLEAIIIGASVSTGTSNLLQTPDIAEIEFVCDEDSFSQYNIKDSGCKKDTPIELIFAPNLIKGKALITWTLELSLPFKVDNLLLITHPQIKYVFIGEDVKKYYETLPSDINKQFISNTNHQDFINLKSEKNYKIKLILGSIPNTNIPEGIRNLEKNDISQISIQSNKIEFWKKSNIASSFSLDGTVFIPRDNPPLVYSAIFSEDKTFFECNMKKIYKRLAVISDVYLEKTNSLINYYINNQNPQLCELYYNPNELAELKSNSLRCMEEISQGCSSVISTLSSSISNTNQNLKRASCPLVY